MATIIKEGANTMLGFFFKEAGIFLDLGATRIGRMEDLFNW